MADAAFTLGSTLASLGLSESTVRRLLAEKLAASDENRAKSLLTDRQNISSGGMLQSSAALQSQADVNLGYDREVASTQSGANDELARIAQQRLDAQAAYDLGLAEEQAKKAAEQEALKPGFDPADPFNWKGIQAEQLANQAKGIMTPGGTPEDPYNWKGIAAEQDAQAPAGSLIVKPPVGRKPTPVKPATPTKPVVVQPPRPGKVVRF